MVKISCTAIPERPQDNKALIQADLDYYREEFFA